MKKFAVLIDNVVDFIYTSEEQIGYGSPYVEIDITDYDGDVRDFDVYADGRFTPGTRPEPTPEPEPTKPIDPNELQKQILVNTEYLIMLGELGGI